MVKGEGKGIIGFRDPQEFATLKHCL